MHRNFPKEAEAVRIEFAATNRQGGEDDIAELYRLRLQAEVWEPAADEFFAGLHIRRGARASICAAVRWACWSHSHEP